VPPPSVQAATAVPAAMRKLSSQGFKFVAPKLTDSKEYVLTAIKTAPKVAPLSAESASPRAVAKAPQPLDDEYTTIMRYLLAHGTSTLGPGQTFMYSEETGEGLLFLPDGNSVRRKLAAEQAHEQVARLRRPDILNEQGELQYNLSLLGKIIKPKAAASRQSSAPAQAPDPKVTARELLNRNEDGIFGWIRNVFKF
jgi:hypothetical protein